MKTPKKRSRPRAQRIPMVFVVTTPGRMSDRTAKRIKRELIAGFRGTSMADLPIVVMSDGMRGELVVPPMWAVRTEEAPPWL